ncbi:unnamed protein product [marine sediment metagenome]|uniref:C1q domain-containing protein n=1 Tax=marine sediment metagenome TaxID=412755 RepID=X1RNS8_9ZZZZ
MGFGDKPYFEGARVYHDADQAIPISTDTILSFNSQRYDTDSIHDPVTNNSRLSCKTAGKYIITLNVTWQQDPVGVSMAMEILLNGSTLIARTWDRTVGSADGYGQVLTTLYDLSVDDYVEARVFQTSPSILNIESRANCSPEFMMQRIG